MTLAELKQVAAGKLAFSLWGPAPSQADLEARQLVLTNFISCIRRTGGSLGLLCFLLSVVFMTGLGCAAYDALNGDGSRVFTGLVGAVAALLAIIPLDRRAINYTKARIELSVELKGLQAIKACACADMLAACAATAEGEAYRQKVLAHQRVFVAAEHDMVVAWAAGAGQRKACAALYETGE